MPSPKLLALLACLVCLSGVPGRPTAAATAREDQRPSGPAAAPAAARAAALAWRDLHAGDVILAKGQTGASHAVMTVSRNPDAWTHAGIVAEVGGGAAFLVHATPDLVAGDGSGVERVAVAAFLAQPVVRAAGVFRPREEGAGRRAGAYAARLVGGGFRFDQKFDLRSRADLYCTELVQLAYRDGAEVDLLAGVSTRVSVLLQEMDLVLPDHLARSRALRHVGDLK